MVYHYSVRKNPRILVLFFVIAILPVAGFALAFIAGPILGIIAGVVALLFSYQIGKYTYFTLRSQIHSHDDGISITMPDGDIVRFKWDGISHSGTALFSNNRFSAFVYDENEDTFVEILPIYNNFDDFLTELEQKTPYEKYIPEHSDDIKELLGKLINGEPV